MFYKFSIYTNVWIHELNHLFQSQYIGILLHYKQAILHIVTNTVNAKFHETEKLKATLTHRILNQTETRLFQVPTILCLP